MNKEKIITFDVFRRLAKAMVAPVRMRSFGHIALTPGITAIGRSSDGFCDAWQFREIDHDPSRTSLLSNLAAERRLLSSSK